MDFQGGGNMIDPQSNFALREYIYCKHGGIECLHCGSSNIAHCSLPRLSEDTEGTIIMDTECHDCGEIWSDIFILSRAVCDNENAIPNNTDGIPADQWRKADN